MKEEYTMNIGFWLCGVLVIPFVIIGVLFAIFKESLWWGCGTIK